MKFFNSQISNYPFRYSVYPDDVQDIPEPSYLLYFPYSILHNLLPKNVGPNTFSLILKTPAVTSGMFCPLASLPNHLFLRMEGIPHECEYDPCLQLPSISAPSRHYISGLSNLYTFSVYHLSTHDNDTSSPTQYEHSTYLQYERSFYMHPYCKCRTFLETKVAAMKLRGFNH